MATPGLEHKTTSSGIKTIESPSANVLAMLVDTKRGIPNQKVPITNYRQALTEFGGMDANSYAMYAFLVLCEYYGVNQIWASRVSGTGAVGSKATIIEIELIVTSKSVGLDSNNFKLIITPDLIIADKCDISLVAPVGDDTSDMTELFGYDGLSTDPDSAMFFGTILNSECKWLDVAIGATLTKTQVNTAIEGLTDNTLAFTGGEDQTSAPIITDYEGVSASKTGIHVFDNEKSIRALLIPDSTIITDAESAVAQKALCIAVNTWLTSTDRQYVQYIDSVKDNVNVSGVKTEVIDTLAIDSKFMTFYWDWVKITDPLTSIANKYLPPAFHAFGEWVVAENTVGVHKAPANSILKGAVGLRYEEVSKGERSVLNTIGVNPMCYMDGSIKVYGARNRTSDTEWLFIHVLRTYIMHWTAIIDVSSNLPFTVADNITRGNVVRNIRGYFRKQDRRINPDGSLYNKTNPTEDPYYVIADERNNIIENMLIVDWGISIVGTNETVKFRTSLWDGGTETVRVQ